MFVLSRPLGLLLSESCSLFIVMCVHLQVNRKNKVKGGESSDESETETVTETQQVSRICK